MYIDTTVTRIASAIIATTIPHVVAMMTPLLDVNGADRVGGSELVDGMIMVDMTGVGLGAIEEDSCLMLVIIAESI